LKSLVSSDQTPNERDVMSSEDSAVFAALRTAIENTVTEFQTNPSDFLSECDVQSLLFNYLRLNSSTLRHTYDVNKVKWRFGDPPNIHRVKTEYHLYEGIRDRFDIAVLSEKPDPTAAIWLQPCRVAIEIKLWQAQEGGGWSGPEEDVKKLQGYQDQMRKKERLFTGIVLLLVHPNAKNCLEAENMTGKQLGDGYPKDGVALHLVNDKHSWKEVTVP
jgi:hypothetical protein